MDDLIDSEFGKHDYDWLLTPPETPIVSSLHSSDHQIHSTVSRGRSTVRSISPTRASKVSTSQLQNGHSKKPARSSSLTRPSILNAYNSFPPINNFGTSIQNTSIASVTSRPSTPAKRSTTPKPSPSPRPVPARSHTPGKTRPAPTSPGVGPTKSHNSRPSTPTSRPQLSTNSNPAVTSSSPRLHSRSSTPTRKPTNPQPAPSTCRATSVGRVRNATPAATRPCSPGPRARAPVQPIEVPGIPADAPPNLRTRLPERPDSAGTGRTRPGAALTTHASLNSPNVVSTCSNRRHSLPVLSHSKFLENSPKGQLRSNEQHVAPSETRKNIVPEGEVKKSSKVGGTTDSTGFGRTISKKSIDMALRHMDIKQSIGGIRSTSIFPHSIRSNAPKGRPARMSDTVVPVTTDEVLAENGSCNGVASPNCNRSVSDDCDMETDKSPQLRPLIARERDFDLYGSTRYDAMILKEDSNNTNWLHNADDKADQSPIFDHRFESLPEPFGLL